MNNEPRPHSRYAKSKAHAMKGNVAMTTQPHYFHSHRAASRAAHLMELASRTHFYIARNVNGRHYVAIYDTHMNHTGNV